MIRRWAGPSIGAAGGGDAMKCHLTLTDRARAVLLLAAVSLLAGVLAVPGPPGAAQETFPTPVGRLGGREPLTPGVMPGELPPEQTPEATPTPTPRSLAGIWLLDFADEDRPPARLVLDADGNATFVDDNGNRGAGAWVAVSPRRVVLALAVRTADTAEGAPLVVLHGAMEVGSRTDVAALEYTTGSLDASGRPGEPTGPFTALAFRSGDG
jgi:hypothetical protein